MFLKRAVLHGFKSFADRTEFEFGPGITSIVGPNGCGKSNLLDAVRWVLGEQSARSLRGGAMSDVIFSGSRSRKPAPFAEVLLTFDNANALLRCEQPEVVIGRILYRNGDSEYRLNGESARLKDIRDLLLDTGVGVDAYSVIEQGRVDQLLQANPLERREIFEEAAGISRYKARRTDAQRKLERTRENLLRLADVIAEVERRYRSVKLAAGKARSYQEYDATLRERRSAFALAEYFEHEQSRAALRSEMVELDAALLDERAALAQRDAQAAEISARLQQLDEQIQYDERALHAVEGDVAALAERIVQAGRRATELAESAERRVREADEVAARRALLAERCAAGGVALEQATAEQHDALERAAARAAAAADAEQACAAARASLERERGSAFEAARRLSLVQSELAALGAQAARVNGLLDRLAERRRQIEADQSAAAARRDELTTRCGELDAQHAAIQDALRADERESAVLAERSTALERDILARKEERSALLSRLALLEDLDRRLEGVDAGTRALLERAASDPGLGVHGVVADVLRIDDPRVALLAPVLAQFESHAVVDSLSADIAAGAGGQGGADALRVLPLDSVRPRALADGYESTPAFVARAAEWVRCSDAMRPLADHLLGRVVIVADRGTAVRLSRDALSGYAFVSLDGWVAHADGRVQFGGASGPGGLIGRKTDMRQLAQSVERVEDDLARLTRERLIVEQATSDVLLRRDAAMDQAARLQREDAGVRSELARSEGESQRLERELRVLDAEAALSQRTLDELAAQRAGCEAQLLLVEQELRAVEGALEQLAASLAERERALADARRLAAEADVRHGRASERREALQRDQVRLGEQLVELEADEQRSRDAADAARRQQEAVLGEGRDAEQRRGELETDLHARRAGVLALREQRSALRDAGEGCSAESRELQRRLDAGEAVLRDKQMVEREHAVRQEALAARVRDELSIDLAERLASYEHAEQDWDAVRAEIEDLRGKIARLGNVNLDSIAELEELTPRFEHLTSQRSDLETSIERLTALISELDEASRTRFGATFVQIQANFQELFRKLFGGGKADIVLQDETNPLECGIDVVARPPGKEPQSISLLSGGERTMTAVALLLAVFRSRPSPFAILDEVDAALDEANTERFNSVLQEFLSHSQFVVITHSKRTMAGADVLYGVTMEEPGVSKRVSVRFNERVDTPSGA